ncbi:MAG: three-Cys-motif partner protein TcmP [Candidatus Binatia bacterium]
MGCQRGHLVQASDGLPARCVGPWSRHKLFYVRGYLDLVSRAMRRTFRDRHYLDLFAGPGRCVVDDGSGEIDGSPLIPFSLPIAFTAYHFAEADSEALAALKARIQRAYPTAQVTYHEGDSNHLIEELRNVVPSSSLNVALVDPTGLHLQFESLSRLTRGRRMDLIYLFPEGMAVKRNIEQFLGQQSSPLDDVLGTTQWRTRFGKRLPVSKDAEAEWERTGRPIVEVFRNQLTSISYKDVRIGSEIVVRNRNNVPLYYLVFASKHRLGHRLWDALQRIDPTGQIKLPLR